jgi:hypothetical protein
MTYLMFVLVLAAYIGRQHKFSCALAGEREDAARPAVDRTQKKCYSLAKNCTKTPELQTKNETLWRGIEPRPPASCSFE